MFIITILICLAATVDCNEKTAIDIQRHVTDNPLECISPVSAEYLLAPSPLMAEDQYLRVSCERAPH